MHATESSSIAPSSVIDRRLRASTQADAHYWAISHGDTWHSGMLVLALSHHLAQHHLYTLRLVMAVIPEQTLTPALVRRQHGCLK